MQSPPDYLPADQDPGPQAFGAEPASRSPTSAGPSAHGPVDGLTLRQWLVAGLRAAFGLRVDMGRAAPSPWQLFWMLAIAAAIQTGLARLEVPGDAVFQFSAWLFPYCSMGLLVFLVWATLARTPSPPGHPAPVAAWLGLWTVAMVPIEAVSVGLVALAARELLPAWWLSSAWIAWLVYGLLWLWLLVVTGCVTAGFAPSRRTQARVVLGVLLVQVFATWQLDSRPWQADYAEQEQDPAQTLTLSQEVFENQQALLANALAAVSPRQAGRINVYGLVFAPYAQDVFVRESAMVAGVLQERFGAQGHVVQLVNHPSVTASLPWATKQNLQRSLQAIAQQMDRERDVLVVYLSSHGGADFRLASAHWPLAVEELTPQLLRTLLDNAGVRHRVIAVSACYSGGWTGPLASDTALVMTAADATHTSYGCGSQSELTFFGRAVFDEQLRQTYSFEQAFSAAVPIIQQREIEGKKDDGFSNPQIVVGKDIRPVLAELERELKQGQASAANTGVVQDLVVRKTHL